MVMSTKRVACLLITGLALYGSLLVNTALAVPQTKKPTKKPAATGNAAQIAAGKKVYDSNGCKACHKIGEAGGSSAPDLTKVGADPKHTAKWLQTQVNSPKTNNPNSTMPPYPQIKGKDIKALVAYLGSLKK